MSRKLATDGEDIGIEYPPQLEGATFKCSIACFDWWGLHSLPLLHRNNTSLVHSTHYEPCPCSTSFLPPHHARLTKSRSIPTHPRRRPRSRRPPPPPLRLSDPHLPPARRDHRPRQSQRRHRRHTPQRSVSQTNPYYKPSPTLPPPQIHPHDRVHTLHPFPPASSRTPS